MTRIELAESSLATKFSTLEIHPHVLITSSCAFHLPQELFSFFFFEPLPRIELGFTDYETVVLPLNYGGMAGNPGIEPG